MSNVIDFKYRKPPEVEPITMEEFYKININIHKENIKILRRQINQERSEAQYCMIGLAAIICLILVFC